MTLSLSLLHVHWILCYRIKNIKEKSVENSLDGRVHVGTPIFMIWHSRQVTKPVPTWSGV